MGSLTDSNKRLQLSNFEIIDLCYITVASYNLWPPAGFLPDFQNKMYWLLLLFEIIMD